MKRELDTNTLLRDREKYRDELVKRFSPLVYKIASKCVRKPSDDVLQEGYIGLIKAIDRYDESKGYKFMTFAYITVWGTIMDYLKRDNAFSSRRFGELYRRFVGMFGKHDGDTKAIMKEIQATDRHHVSSKSLDNIDSVFQNGMLRLNDKSDKVPDERDYKAYIENIDELKYIKKVLLDDVYTSARSKDIYIRYFFEGESAKSIAARYNVTVSRIHEINGVTSRHLREVLVPYLERVSA